MNSKEVMHSSKSGRERLHRTGKVASLSTRWMDMNGDRVMLPILLPVPPIATMLCFSLALTDLQMTP